MPHSWFRKSNERNSLLYGKITFETRNKAMQKSNRFEAQQHPCLSPLRILPCELPHNSWLLEPCGCSTFGAKILECRPGSAMKITSELGNVWCIWPLEHHSFYMFVEETRTKPAPSKLVIMLQTRWGQSQGMKWVCDAAARGHPLCISAELFVSKETTVVAAILAGYAIAEDFGCLISTVSEQENCSFCR